ncbi:MAG: hypothetical protein ACJ8BW_29905 [Ktedonobacteraceae bacterium]
MLTVDKVFEGAILNDTAIGGGVLHGLVHAGLRGHLIPPIDGRGDAILRDWVEVRAMHQGTRDVIEDFTRFVGAARLWERCEMLVPCLAAGIGPQIEVAEHRVRDHRGPRDWSADKAADEVALSIHLGGVRGLLHAGAERPSGRSRSTCRYCREGENDAKCRCQSEMFVHCRSPPSCRLTDEFPKEGLYASKVETGDFLCQDAIGVFYGEP